MAQNAADLASVLTLVLRHLWSSVHIGLSCYSICNSSQAELISSISLRRLHSTYRSYQRQGQ